MFKAMLFGAWLLVHHQCCINAEYGHPETQRGSVLIEPLIRRSPLEKNFIRFGRSWTPKYSTFRPENINTNDYFYPLKEYKDPFIRLTRNFDPGKNDLDSSQNKFSVRAAKSSNFIRFGRSTFKKPKTLKSSNNPIKYYSKRQVRDVNFQSENENLQNDVLKTRILKMACEYQDDPDLKCENLNRILALINFLKQNMIREQRAKDNFLRFGRIKDDNFDRFGRSKDNFLRFGRGNVSRYIENRLQRSDDIVRSSRAKENFLRFGRSKEDGSIRFGKGDFGLKTTHGANSGDDCSNTLSEFENFKKFDGNCLCSDYWPKYENLMNFKIPKRNKREIYDFDDYKKLLISNYGKLKNDEYLDALLKTILLPTPNYFTTFYDFPPPRNYDFPNQRTEEKRNFIRFG